jgi:hypothetical protein
MASEVGVLDIPESKIVKKWRLQPGKMLLVDLDAGRIVDDDELKRTLATAKPYRDWVSKCRLSLEEMPEPAPPTPSSVPVLDRQQAFGYTQEDLKIILAPMARTGEEAIGSMGNDAALTVLSDRPKVFYNYFKQLFAQVTNPPIDPIREELVMSLVSFIGPRPNLLAVDTTDEPPMRLEVQQPVLTPRTWRSCGMSSSFRRRVPLDRARHLLSAAWGGNGWRLRWRASPRTPRTRSTRASTSSSCRIAASRPTRCPSPRCSPRPPCTSTWSSRIAHIDGTRRRDGRREVHQFALLAGYGAEAIHPYLALETLAELSVDLPAMDPKDAQKRCIKAICKG